MNDAGGYDSARSIKTGLLELLDDARLRKREFIGDLSETQREAVGEPGRWSARDVITHVTFWEQWHTRLLAGNLRGDEPPAAPDEEEVNNRLLAEHRLRP